MGLRKIKVIPSAAENIASIAYFVESKGLASTAIKFTDGVYDFIIKLADTRKSFVPAVNLQEPCLVTNV
ncbi:MAG: hypothetical protein K2X48_15700 [Chitinophagaceae bacterium]|nr:hypothetical protein [Chitinophagaceae bacterium]